MKHINVLPQSYVQRKNFIRSLGKCIAAMAIFFMFLLLFVLGSDYTIRFFEQKIMGYSQQIEDEKFLESENLAKQLKAQHTLLAFGKEDESLVRYAQENISPQYFVFLGGLVEKIRAVEIKIDNLQRNISFVGTADSVSEIDRLVSRITSTHVFQSLELVEIERRDDGRFRFVLHMKVRDNPDEP